MPSASSRAERLRVLLDAFQADARPEARIPFDPVEFPHRYRARADVEVSALLSASLAYGRADLFKPKLHALLSRMGPHPAKTVEALDPGRARALLEGFVYRFNVGADVAVLLLGMGKALRTHGSLEALFLQGFGEGEDLHLALGRFTAALRDVPMGPIRKALGKERGLGHLLPSPLGPGAAKRLNLFLRWMVRGPDAVDFGLWKRVPPSALIIPLDTHIHRVATRLGFTRRKDLSWRTAVEITRALQRVDPADPVRFDFALCHHGMSGICPAKLQPESCRRCLLLETCIAGPRAVARL